jgi:hypothetical protein
MCADNADDVPLAPIARGRARRAAPSCGGRDLAARRSGGAFLAQRDCELAPVLTPETLRAPKQPPTVQPPRLATREASPPPTRCTDENALRKYSRAGKRAGRASRRRRHRLEPPRAARGVGRRHIRCSTASSRTRRDRSGARSTMAEFHRIRECRLMSNAARRCQVRVISTEPWLICESG